ncbi:MAG: ABC transporter permease [Pseudomonadota bacterium]
MLRQTPWTLGVALTLMFVGAAVFGPLIYSVDPDAQNLMSAFAHAGSEHPLGTDQLGRDILARVLHGARYSAGIAVSVILFSLAMGCVLAGVAMWFGGIVSTALTLFSDAVYALPGLLVTILLADVLGGGAVIIIFLLWLVAWPEYFRLSYSIGQHLMNSDHVLASRLAGASGARIFRLQVVPVILPYLLSLGAISVGRIVLSIATLGFLGIGIAPPQAEWGMMINDLRVYWQIAPIQLAAPVLAIVWIVLALLILSQSMPKAKVGFG